MILGQHKAAQFRPEVAIHPARQRRHDQLPVRRQPALPAIADAAGPQLAAERSISSCADHPKAGAGHLGHLLGAGTAGTMDEAPTGAVPAMAVGRMGVAPRLTEGEPMGVGLSPREEVLLGVLKPRSRLRSNPRSNPRSRLRRATPTDKEVGGADRDCVEDPISSNLSAKAPFQTVPERG